MSFHSPLPTCWKRGLSLPSPSWGFQRTGGLDFSFFFFSHLFHRRCMAVVSPWLQSVPALCLSVFYGHCLFQKKPGKFFWFFWFSGEEKGVSFFSKMGSRLVIMALMEWATPVLQRKAQNAAKENSFANHESFPFSDQILQLGFVKSESWVIVEQLATVNLSSFSRVHTACHVRKIFWAGRTKEKKVFLKKLESEKKRHLWFFSQVQEIILTKS